MKDHPRWRLRRRLHRQGFHWFCSVVVTKVVVNYVTDMRPEFLVGEDPLTGEPFGIETTVYGGRRIPVYDWKVVHQ